MQQVISKAQILETVRQAVAETLERDAGAIHPEHSLTRDLGAESLDFLDINYRLEQAFGIRMARQFLLDHAEEMFGEGIFLDGETRLTAKGARLLEVRFGARAGTVSPGLALETLPALVTVAALADTVAEILDTLPERCEACGGGAWKAVEGSRISCRACGAPARFATGDDLLRVWLKEAEGPGR